MNLYVVTCKGMTSNIGSNTAHGLVYVVASDPTAAYKTVRDYLDQNKIGFQHEREMESVKLIASSAKYPNCGIRIMFQNGFEEGGA